MFSKIPAMSTNEQTQLSQPTSAVRNTLGKDQASQNLVRPISDEDLREYCDKNYHQILSIIAEKLHQEKAQQEKLKAVKARLNFEEASRYSESEMPSRRRNLTERLGPRYARTRSGNPEPKRGRSKSPREKDPKRRTIFKRLEKGTHKAATKVFALKKQKLLPKNIATKESIREERKQCQKVKEVQEGTRSQNQINKSRVLRMTYPNHAYAKKHILLLLGSVTLTFQKPECLAILKHMMKESIPRKLPPTEKCIKDSVEIHNIKQMDRESMEEFVHAEEAGQKQNFKRGNFWNEQMTERKQDRFSLLTKTPKEILALDKGKFKPPSSMTTPVEKRNASKFCEFHREELKQNHRKEQAKTAKKGETSGKDKPLAILMVQPWQRIARLRITQTFSPESIIFFPTLGEEDGTEGPMIIEAEMGGHCVHRIYVDRGSSSKILYEHCFRQTSLLVKIGDEEHSTSPWMNFMVVRSPSPYNRIIGRSGVRKIRAIPSTTKPTDMTGVPRYIAEHRLNVCEGCLPVKQKKMGQAPERNKAIIKEVKKLVEADIIKKSITTAGYQTQEIKMKLNPKKCAFGMREGTFLGYKVDADGLRKCAKKIDFQWTAEAEMAFKGMKQLIAELPMLTVPKEKEELIMYLAATKEAISTVLMTERDGKQYRPMTSVKGQILADFIVEYPEDDTPDTSIEDMEEISDPWILFTNGSSCIDGSGAGLIITNPEGMEFTYALRFRSNATNNEAEYEALIAGLRIVRKMGVQNLQANVDSKLVANQVNGIYIAKESSMIKEKLIGEKEILAVVEEEGHTWMTSVYEYLTEGILPEEKKKARDVRRKAGRYAVINEVLYKKSFLGPWLRDNPFKDWCEKLMIPAEIGMPTFRTAEVDIVKNNEDLGISLDLLEEKREKASVQEARSKAKMERYSNARV
uniref:Reverse transcriptase domain-containing protein n=1 Tax=Tanacetum cinerariifolium TaxID=118510 RepID=A0A6L2KKR3_TANCI|nr:reverse transcriptase domain-containing protein [Tanacetum cinerariifolium]